MIPLIFLKLLTFWRICKVYVNIIIRIRIIHYIYIALFCISKHSKHSTLSGDNGGGSSHPPPLCSIHLDDATAAIVCQNAHHTPAYWWRGDWVMKPISGWGWLGGHDGQRPIGEFGQDAEVTPLLFSKDILGFLMNTENQELGLMSIILKDI